MVVSTAHKITETLNAFTSKPDGIPGVVFRALKKDGTLLYEGASGVRGIDHKNEVMTLDTLFWIASCTKLLTAVAAMQLLEQGKIALDENAENYIPEIGHFQILSSFSGDQPILQASNTKITIRHLLSHTSGCSYPTFNSLTLKYSDAFNVPGCLSAKRGLLSYPLMFEPGTDWEYGSGMDWIGLIIEKVTGQTLGAYMKQHIFDPLGAHSPTFLVETDHNARAYLHLRKNNILAEVPPIMAQIEEVEMHMGGAGAHSNAIDYSTVLHALLNDGIGANGQRILKKESVYLLFQDQSTSLGVSLEKVLESAMPDFTHSVSSHIGVPKAWTFGGMQFNVDLPTGRSSGSVWWAGLPNCFWWIDRTKGVCGVIMTQISPLLDGEVLACWSTCERLVYEGL